MPKHIWKWVNFDIKVEFLIQNRKLFNQELNGFVTNKSTTTGH